MSSTPSPETKPELAAQIAKVRARLAQWAAEEASDEPEWDIEDIERLQFRSTVVEREALESSPPPPSTRSQRAARASGR